MERDFCGSLGPAQKAITLDLGTVEPHALPSVLSAREKEERNQWFAAQNEMLETRNWRDCYMDFVNKNFVNDSDAAEDDDPASDENDMKLEVGMERDEPLAGPVLRSSGEPNLPKNDGWNGDKEDEVEEQEEQDEESVEQEELLSDNSDGEAEEEATSIYTTVGHRDGEVSRQEVWLFTSRNCETEQTGWRRSFVPDFQIQDRDWC